jgi:AraC-like DNA-binding protein
VKAVFASSISFGARVDEIVLPLSARSVPIVNADPYLNSLLLRYCEEVISKRRVKEGAWRLRVENAIAPLLPHGEASVHKVAQRLGVSPRTLARRLGDENVTFLEVLNELRLGLARQYLSEDGLKIAEVAWLLGYERGTELQVAGIAVRNDGDRTQIGEVVARQDVGDLLDGRRSPDRARRPASRDPRPQRGPEDQERANQ